MNGTASVESLNDIIVLRQKVLIDLPAVVDSLKVKPFDDESKALANRIAQGIQVVLKKIDDKFDPSIDAAKRAVEQSKALKAELADVACRYKGIVKRKLTDALNEEAEIRAKQEAEERERKRKEKEEQERIAADKKRKDDEALEAAAAAERAGLTSEAQQIFEKVVSEPVQVPVVVQAPQPSIPARTILRGSAVVTRWKYRVVNPELVPDEFWILDDQKLGAYTRTRKEAAVGTIPGVEFYSEEDIRIGGRL